VTTVALGRCQLEIKNAKKLRKNQWSSPLSNCMVHWQFISQNDALQTAWHSPVMLRRLCLCSGGDGDVRTAVLGQCHSEVKNAEKSRKNQWSSPQSNYDAWAILPRMMPFKQHGTHL
jgi:hypothetical protein